MVSKPGSSRHQYPDHEGQAVANSNAEETAEDRLLELLSQDHLPEIHFHED